MANGTLNGSTSNTKINVKVNWSSTPNTAGNYSTVTAKLYYKRTNNYTTYGTWKGSITINGVKTTGSKYIEVTSSDWVLALTATTKVNHNANGSKSINIAADGGISGTTLSSSTLSGTAKLDTIARKATITSAQNFTDEQNPIIKYSNPAGNTATVDIGIYKTDGSTALVGYQRANSTAGSYTFNFTSAQRTTLQNACKDAMSMPVRFYIRTSIGSSVSYHYVEKTLSIVNCKPTISPDAYDIDSISLGLTRNKYIWIKGYSDIKYDAGLSLKKGATLKSCTVTCGGVKSYNPTGIFGAVRSNKIDYVITDSRGQTVTGSYTAPTFIDYFAPTYSINVKNVLTTAQTGKFTIEVTGHFYNGSLGAVTNTLTANGLLRVNDGPPVAIVGYPLAFENDPNKYLITYEMDGLPYDNEYHVSFTVNDVVTEAYNQPVISFNRAIKFEPVFDWSNEDFNFNVPVTIQGGQVPSLVEQGTTYSGWNYRKWSDGLYECWQRKVVSAAVANASSASGWYSSGAVSETNLSYPITFVEVPTICVSLSPTTNTWALVVPGSTAGSTSQTGNYQLLATYTHDTDRDYIFNYQVKGKWK